jgi:four helix bundle protein
MSDSIVKGKSYAFALSIVELCVRLKEQKHFEMASQLLRAGTSIGANVEEALAGYTRKDFVAKMAIASKEARESRYWLRLLTDAKILQDTGVGNLLDRSEELIKILTKIVKTASAPSVPYREPCVRDSKQKTQNLGLKT